MIRLFNQHVHRKQSELDGFWDFTPLETPSNLPDTFSDKILVPSCWESNIKYSTYRGYGLYRRKIHVDEETSLRLFFYGVSHKATVFFDKIEVGNHYNAYTGFEIILKDIAPGDHELMVLVSNNFDQDSALHLPNDYYSYGGITRPVSLEYINKLYIKDVQFTPIWEDGLWSANVKVSICNISSSSQSFGLKCLLNSQSIYENQEEIRSIDSGEEIIINFSYTAVDVMPWSPESPHLYFLTTQIINPYLGEVVDDLIERVGFRSITVQGNRLLLNNEPFIFKGFNRHEDFNLSGNAITVQEGNIDLNFLSDMGANAVRTSHYPNDTHFLDMCDERGFAIWEENHARGLSLDQMDHPNFRVQCYNCNQEMVTQHYNHPSILIWGILNECASDSSEGRTHYHEQLNQIRSLDQTRPLTFASHQHFKDICFDLVDIVSVNLYHGWYGEHKTVHGLQKAYEEELEWIQSTPGHGKPIIISEFGAGALYGYHSPQRVKWSEERQADIIDQCLSLYLHRQEIVGTFIWQLADCRVTDEVWGIQRPRTINNKGILDEYRRPKMAYSKVKDHYQDL